VEKRILRVRTEAVLRTVVHTCGPSYTGHVGRTTVAQTGLGGKAKVGEKQLKKKGLEA
jgi:hypothetical protein